MTNFHLDPSLISNIYLASGSSHHDLASLTAKSMGISLGDVERRMFPNTELYVRYGESVRGKHVFAIQSLAAVDGRSVNDSFMELMIMVDAASVHLHPRLRLLLRIWHMEGKIEKPKGESQSRQRQ